MTAGLTDRSGLPFGTWQYRFIDWFRDLIGQPMTDAVNDMLSFAR